MNIKYLTKYSDLDDCINELLSKPRQWLGCDTETTGLDCHSNKIRLIQIANGECVYIIDAFKIKNWATLFSKLTKIRTFNWVFHNFKFDLQFFWQNGVDFHNSKVLDTMVASQLISAGLSLFNDLNSVAQRYLDIEVDKTEQKSDWSVKELSEKQIEYAAKDAHMTRLLGKTMLPILMNSNLIEVYKLERRSLESFCSMEYFGMSIDLDRLSQIRPIYEEQQVTKEDEFLNLVEELYPRYNLLDDLIYKGLELSSSTQVLEVLRKLEIPNPLYNPKGREPEQLDRIITSTGSNVVKLLDIQDYPILEYLIGYRKASKLLNAYVYSFPDLVNPVTGRLHTKFKQLVSTGRASSSSPNLQNLSRPDGNPLNLRSCFIPTEGYHLVQGDYSQIELRVIAEIIYNLSGDRKMLDEFINGRDPYLATAALMANLNYDDMFEIGEDGSSSIKKQYKALRQNAKAVRLGYNYGMGWKKFRNYAKIQYGVGMSLDDAKANRELYFSSYPGLQVYHDSFNDRDIRVVYSLPPFNRPRYFEDYPGIPALANHPVQSTSADIQKLAMADMYDELYSRGYSPTQSHKMRQLVTIHDEIISEAIPDLLDECKYIQQTCMENAAKVVLALCPVEAEAGIIENLAQK